MSLLAAFQFLTILPIKRTFTTEQIAHSTIFFPVVGLAIGLVLALINWLLDFLIPGSVINIILVALLAYCSGGLHLDGLADSMDGAAGHRSVERRLEIMRDSRIGGFGAIGLILMLLMEYVFLNAIPGNLKWVALIAAPTISRWAMVYAIYAYPYARSNGLGKAFKDGVTHRHFGIASLVTAALTVGLWGLAGVGILAGAFIIATLAALYLKSLLKGLTGDSYGAINEVAAVSVFLIIIMLTHNNWLMHSWWF